MPRLPPEPALDWTASGPVDRASGDVFFSASGGLDETKLVFLQGCDLPAAWAGKDRFCIVEIGLGAGLNLAATLALWRRHRPPSALLHYHSIERAPFAETDAQRALGLFPEIAAEAQAVLDQWPARAQASQRALFDADGVLATFHIGEAEEILPCLIGPVDAWFLDGFAPARNPDAWSAKLFAAMARLSSPGARAATYSVAGPVRRGLESAGFTVAKRPGFRGKRERLEAQQPPANRPITLSRPARPLILGAGIAGAAIGHALAQRGAAPIVIGAGAKPADGASGNPLGLVTPRFDRGGGPVAALLLASFLYATRFYQRRAPQAILSQGVEMAPSGEDGAARWRDLLADPPLDSAHWRPGAADGEGFAVEGLAIDPRAAIAALLGAVETRLGRPVAAIVRQADTYVCRDALGFEIASGDALVLAGGAGLAALARFAGLARDLRLELSRGQVSWARAPNEAGQSARSGGSYLGHTGQDWVFGASFARAATDHMPDLSEADHADNRQKLARLAPRIAATIAARPLEGRASLRCASPDRLPIIDLAAPRFGICGALGARGLTFAPLAGEIIADLLDGAAPIVLADALARVSLQRFAAAPA